MSFSIEASWEGFARQQSCLEPSAALPARKQRILSFAEGATPEAALW